MTNLSDREIATTASALVNARASRQALTALPMTVWSEGDAYRIQDAYIDAILADFDDARIIGRKIGCTNKSAQEQLGVDGPFHGALLSPFVFTGSADVPARIRYDNHFMCQLEPEVAFRLGRDLDASDMAYDADNVRSAVAAALPAIEVVDSRYTDWTTIGAMALIADNASNGCWIYGPEMTAIDEIDFTDQATSLTANNAVVAEGNTANVLGDPLAALAWLANRLSATAHPLKAGDLVTTGTTTKVIPARRGDVATADFGSIGAVSVAFE